MARRQVKGPSQRAKSKRGKTRKRVSKPVVKEKASQISRRVLFSCTECGERASEISPLQGIGQPFTGQVPEHKPIEWAGKFMLSTIAPKEVNSNSLGVHPITDCISRMGNDYAVDV